MRNAFTTAYSDLIQNQIELASTLTSLIGDASSRGASATQIDELRQRLDSFELQLKSLSRNLIERHDSMENCQRDQDQPDTAST